LIAHVAKLGRRKLAHKYLNPVALGVAATFTLAAVTAVAVAPRSSNELIGVSTVEQAVAVKARMVGQATDTILQTERVRRGDTLATVLARLGAVDPQFLEFVDNDPAARKVQHLRPGRTVNSEIDSAGRITRFSYRVTSAEENAGQTVPNPALKPGRRITITRDSDAFMVREENVNLLRSIEARSVQFDGDFFAATNGAGIPDSVAGQIDDIFGSNVDIDAIKRGDAMRVVYESFRELGSLDADVGGRVLAVELNTQGKRLDAAWYERVMLDGKRLGRPKGDYFTLAGYSLKRTFLRNPLESGHLMSGFSQARMHPMAKEWRAHKGVDVAAAVGTPVRSVGDGTIEFRGQQRGYGNVIIVKHQGQSSTLYAHMNEFAEGVKQGSRVNQGEVIGYVGQTGMATGPHLHYEFRINDQQTDPMTVSLPESKPFDPFDRRRFAEIAGQYRTQFSQLGEVRLARFE
jgi:murein DD-endopeptidase MepM/ murein hydrolase activator NlpD